METLRIDHVNIKIPEAEIEQAVEFYRGHLGLEVEDVDAFQQGDRPIFSFRIAPEAVIHVSPVDDFERPNDRNFAHFAVILDEDSDSVKQDLEEAGVDIERESVPTGATGDAPAIYVRDPFGYLVELKEPVAEVEG